MEGGTQITHVASSKVNVTVILTLIFYSLITFIRHGSIFNFQYKYVLFLVLCQADHGKSPMVSHQVNVSVIVPNSINVIVTTIHDYITVVNI